MNIYKAVANIDPSDCHVYLLQGKTSTAQITLGSQGKIIAFDLLKDITGTPSSLVTYVSSVNQFTLLPNSSIEQLPLSELQSFLKWNEDTSSSIIKNKLIFDNISLLFQIRLQEITKSVPSAQFKHAVELIANHSMKQQENNAITSLLVDNQLILCVIKNGNLQLSNIFQVENNDEVTYYIMLMVQELGLDAETLNLQIFGECEEKAILQENLSHFVRNVVSHTNANIPNMKYSGVAKFIEMIQ